MLSVVLMAAPELAAAASALKDGKFLEGFKGHRPHGRKGMFNVYEQGGGTKLRYDRQSLLNRT